MILKNKREACFYEYLIGFLLALKCKYELSDEEQVWKEEE